MKHTTLLKGRMPAKLVDYLLQIPTNIRQVQVSQGGLVISDTFSVGSLTKIGLDLQLTMLLKVRTPRGGVRTLRALIDTGAEANLVRQNLLESGCFELASDPIQLVAANGQRLVGGTRTTTLEIEFNPYENGNFLDKKCFWMLRATKPSFLWTSFYPTHGWQKTKLEFSHTIRL